MTYYTYARNCYALSSTVSFSGTGGLNGLESGSTTIKFPTSTLFTRAQQRKTIVFFNFDLTGLPDNAYITSIDYAYKGGANEDSYFAATKIWVYDNEYGIFQNGNCIASAKNPKDLSDNSATCSQETNPNKNITKVTGRTFPPMVSLNADQQRDFCLFGLETSFYNSIAGTYNILFPDNYSGPLIKLTFGGNGGIDNSTLCYTLDWVQIIINYELYSPKIYRGNQKSKELYIGNSQPVKAAYVGNSFIYP